MDSASKATLENEFGTSNDEEAIKQILEKGTLQESEVRIFLPLLSFYSPSLN
jgi:ribosome maturation protein Sdo1